MTVCIAAVCEGGKKIVVTAERMFTVGGALNIEFETAERKIEKLSHSCTVMAAGNSAYASEIIRATAVSLAGRETTPIEDVLGLVSAAYISVRNAKISEQILFPALGPDYLKWEKMGTSLPQYLQPQAGMYQQIVMMMQQFNIGTDMIVAGVVGGTGRLAVITNPGTTAWFDKLGYTTIGSGSNHAATRLALGGQTKYTPLVETLYQVFEAKKASEVAPGVGSATDIAIIAEDNTIYCDSRVLEKLNEIFDGAGGRKPDNLDALHTLLGVGT